MDTLWAGYATQNGEQGADYFLIRYGMLPNYYISRTRAENLGWKPGKNLSEFARGKMLTKGVYRNENGKLPKKDGRIWYEADINYTKGKRNAERILFSNDGLVFVTYDHYDTFVEIVKEGIL